MGIRYSEVIQCTITVILHEMLVIKGNQVDVFLPSIKGMRFIGVDDEWLSSLSSV